MTDQIDSPERLLSLAKSYAKTTPIPVDHGAIRWESSDRMTRAAGKAILKRRGKLKTYTIRLSWKAAEAWGWGDDMKGVIRHELIHILDYQRIGRSDHGPGFERLAHKYDAPLHCPQFCEYRYLFHCEECGKFLGGRFKRSKLVKDIEQSRRAAASNCCGAAVTVEGP